MIYRRKSVMLDTMVLNYSVGSTGLLVASGVGVFLGTEKRVVVGY